MNFDTILSALGQLGSFFKVINKNDWAEDTMLASGVIAALVDLLKTTGGHITLDTLTQAATYTALGILAKAVMSLLTALHVLKAPPVTPQ